MLSKNPNNKLREIPANDLLIEPKSQIGRGSSASVYKTIYKKTMVAVKVFNKPKSEDKGISGNENLNPFEYEKKMYELVGTHKNIVGIVGCITLRNWLVLEYVQKGTLADLTSRFRLPENKQTRFAIDLFSAIAYLHENNILHRDIKPQNILVSGDFVLKLTDFGLAVDVNANKIINQGGTIPYVAPEVLESEEIWNTYRSSNYYFTDITSAAIVCNEWMTGESAFSDNFIFTNYPLSFFVKHYATPYGLRPSLPKGGEINKVLLDIVKTCFSASPTDRPTAKQCLDMLSMSISNNNNSNSNANTNSNAKNNTNIHPNQSIDENYPAHIAVWIASYNQMKIKIEEKQLDKSLEFILTQILHYIRTYKFIPRSAGRITDKIKSMLDGSPTPPYFVQFEDFVRTELKAKQVAGFFKRESQTALLYKNIIRILDKLPVLADNLKNREECKLKPPPWVYQSALN